MIEAGLPLWKRTGLCNKDTNMVMQFGTWNRKRWIAGFEEDLQIMGVRQWRKPREERAEWKKITEKAKTHIGL